MNGRPVQWSLLIGENGAGKTTLLECLAWMWPAPEVTDAPASSPRGGEIVPFTDGQLYSSLRDAENEVLETLPGEESTEVKLAAKFEFGSEGFGHDTNRQGNASPPFQFGTGVRLEYDVRGHLSKYEPTDIVEIGNLPRAYHHPLIVSYGANRSLGDRNLVGFEESDPLDHDRLSKTTELCDIEELLMSLDYAARDEDSAVETRALELLIDAIRRILPQEPPIEIEIHPPDILDRGRRGGVYARTFTGLVRMPSLSLGYRTTASWVIDFAWRLLNRYPNSQNPLSEPAVVLLDEIDLHLHPRWQLLIMKELSSLFPATQFIATSHSPLIVQVAEEAKLILLEKQDEDVRIESDPDVPRTLRVDQILTSLLFGVPSTRSPSVQDLLDKRAELLNKANRTPEEEDLLQDIRQRIAELPVAHDYSDQVALDLIRRFADRLKENESRGS